MEGDTLCADIQRGYKNFNPLPPHGGRRERHLHLVTGNGFQSTPSAWRETLTVFVNFRLSSFQSTPSAWRETFTPAFILSIASYFNPLPPHGGRRCCALFSMSNCVISIHSLRMEGDGTFTPRTDSLKIFQSTPSAWRETSPHSIFA